MESFARRRQEHLEALHGRLKKFLLEMFNITDDHNIADLCADLTPLTALTIGDLKMLLSAVEGELERHRERERGAKGVVVEA